MKRGPKPAPPETKKAQGSFQACRSGHLTEIPANNSVPQQPDWLTEAGREVWLDDIARVTQGSLVTERDSSVFGHYCNLAGALIEAWRAKEVPPTSAIAEMRKMAEQFGIFGRKSRLVADGGAAPSNPFARNGSQAR